jgi:hypothetical protein
VLQQVVALDDGGERTWFVGARNGRLEVGAGRHPAPTITFRLDEATARAVHEGLVSAQQAFMTGRLRLGGDVQVLLEQHEALASIDDVFAEVRTRTSFGDPVEA